MTTICSFLSAAVLARMFYYLSIAFVTTFGHLAAVPVKGKPDQGKPDLQTILMVFTRRRTSSRTKKGVLPISFLLRQPGAAWL
jgi:hypothetical protein